MKKPFPLTHILSVTAGRLCGDIGGIYDILNHVTGDNLFTHALPRACQFAKPLILEAHPELAFAGSVKNIARLDELLENAKDRGESLAGAIELWIRWMMEPGECGLKAEYDIENYADSWLTFDPVDELRGMVGEEKIRIVTPGDIPVSAAVPA